ncbi:hypothetical protein DFA_06933 [Cavenderia fasciculata]|uniref:Uncharacterized protein n=1 Tax=Cavenderia fasciculata TaxID=261658 RepID=F4PX28_CACFS|nr:uncharacterized protein DFA_06933 [Cavenderia fasciculata]EGG19831.1 hypothetical protein DFA_06933 [Cavenderia fasciculata]|eukprot:XP_004358177.1 hypothetical protein DFA_06933 [Cavenderia fasciculata]
MENNNIYVNEEEYKNTDLLNHYFDQQTQQHQHQPTTYYLFLILFTFSYCNQILMKMPEYMYLNHSSSSSQSASSSNNKKNINDTVSSSSSLSEIPSFDLGGSSSSVGCGAGELPLLRLDQDDMDFKPIRILDENGSPLKQFRVTLKAKSPRMLGAKQ